MDDQVLISAASINDVGAENYTYQSVARICVKSKNVERKIGKKREIERKIISARKKLSKSSGKKTGDNICPTIFREDVSENEDNMGVKSFKRITTTADQSGIGIELEKEGETSAKSGNFQERNESPKRKNARNEESKDNSDLKMEDDSNTIHENTGRKINGNKNSNAKQSTSKPIDQSEATNDEEENLKEKDLYVLGSVMLPKEVLKVCIQNIKSPNGASLDEIYEQTKTISYINLDYMKSEIERFVRKAVESGLLHQYLSIRYKF